MFSENKKLLLSQIKIERLSKEHDTFDFDCEDKDLNDFIKNDALNEKYEGWNQTYVATFKGENKVVGFFAISNDSFDIVTKIKEGKNKPYPSIPATKIGRLAVDKSFQNKGVGEYIVKYAIGFIIDQICKNIGCRYITLDAYSGKVEWYKKHFQFTENTLIKDDGETSCINLILDLKTFAEKLKK